jgi:glycosyltransferase involved in cell wall biosynthesis
LTLHVRLERPLPGPLPPGRATAAFCVGTCAEEHEQLASLEVLVDGARHPASASGMAPQGGFWATVPIIASDRDTVELQVAARLKSGASETAELGSIEIAEPEPLAAPPGRAPVPRSPGPGLIAVCMATFEPDMELFRAQVRSLREQRDERWVCVISDDCSSPERFAEIEAELAGDDRFSISRSEQRLGFYRNFERALRLVPAAAELIALCDQDDRWHPDKLAVLRDALGGAVLAYSDLRLVEADGRVLRETLWRGRSNNSTDLAAMLVANTITGAATLFRRSLLDVLLPFPDTPGFQFHDHWLAVAALATGEVAYVDRPLYDYVQHRGAVFGHVTHGGGERPGRLAAITDKLRAITGTPLRWRAAYFYGYLAREVQAQVLLARCGSALTPAKRRALERFIAADRSTGALLWLSLRPLRAVAGHTETLAGELELAGGLVWKRVASWGARHGRLPAAWLDATVPPLDAFTQKRLRRWRARIEAR